MSKSLQRIILLIGLGIGFSVFALYQMFKGPDSDHVFLGLAYLATGIVAFVAVLRLPAKPAE